MHNQRKQNSKHHPATILSILARSLNNHKGARQWANLWFGLVVWSGYINEYCNGKFAVASWSEQIGAVAGVMASQIVLRQRPNLLPLDMKALVDAIYSAGCFGNRIFTPATY